MTDPQHREPRNVIPSTPEAELDGSLGAPLRAWVGGPALRDTFRSLFAGALTGCACGWPRMVLADRSRELLRDGDALVELTRRLDPASLALSLPATVAVRLVESLLGTPTRSELPSGVGRPSEAECGVLAYAAARLLGAAAASAEAWQVRDVRTDETQLALRELPIAWPLALQTELGALDTTLWLSAASAAAWHPHVRLRLALHEQVDARALAQLRVGDVWISESATLTQTSAGLVGPVSLAVPGTQTRLAGRITGGRVRALGLEQMPSQPLATSGTERVELVLVEQPESVHALAGLASGRSLRIHADLGACAQLRRHDEVLATGVLVTWRGQLGLRVQPA